jgi:hypothetical protein
MVVRRAVLLGRAFSSDILIVWNSGAKPDSLFQLWRASVVSRRFNAVANCLPINSTAGLCTWQDSVVNIYSDRHTQQYRKHGGCRYSFRYTPPCPKSA